MGVVYKCREHGNTIRIYRRKTPPKKLEDNSMEDNKSDKIKKEHAIQLPSDDRQRAGHDCNKIKTKADYKTVMSTEELKLVKENSSASTITQLQNIFPGIDSYLKVRNRKPSTKSCLAKSRTYKKPNPLRTRERSSTDSISSLWSSLKKKSLTTKSMYQSRSKPKEAHDLEGKSDMIPAFGQVGHYNCYTEHDSDKSEGLRSRSLTYTTRKFLIQGSHNKSGTYCQQCNKSKSQMTIQMHRLASGGMVAINDQHQSICGTGLCSECSKPFPNQCKSYSFLPPDKCRSTTNYQTRCAFCKPNIDGKSQSAITIQPVISGPGRIKIPIVCAACQKKHNSQHTVCTQASGEDRNEQASAGSNSSIPKLALRSAQTLHRRTLPNYEYLAQMATDELGPVFEIPRTGKKIELRLRTVNNNNPPVHQEITIPTVGLPMCLKSEDVLSHGLESVLSVNIDRSKNAKFNTLITNMLNQNVKMEQKKIESVKQAVKESAEAEASKEEQLLNKLTNTAIQTEHTITDLVKLLEQQANQQTQECLVEPTAVKVDELKEAEKIPGSYFYWKPPKDSGPRKMELYNYADYYNLYGNKQSPRSQLAADINFQHIIAEQSGAALLESWKKINTDVSPYTGLQGNQKEPQTQFQYHASVRHHDRSQERLRDRSHGHDRMHGHDRIQGHDHIHNHDHGHCHERRHSQDRGHIQDHNHMQERSHSQDRNHSHERSHGHIHDRSHSHSRSPTPCHRHESMNRSDKNQSQHRPKHDHGGHIPETYSTRCTHDHPQSRGPSPCKVRGGTGYNDPNAILDLSRAYRHNSPQGCVGSRYTYSEYCNRHQSPERRPQGTWTSDINTSIRDHPEGKRRSRHNSPHCARRRSRSNSSNVHDNKKKSVKYEDFSCQAYDPPTTPVYDREVIPPTAFFASAPAPNYYEKPESHCMTPINNPNYQMQHYPNFERRNSVHQIPFNSQVFSARSCSPSSQQGKQMRQPCDPCMSIYTGQRSTPSPQLPPIYPDERSPGNYVSPMDGQATSIRHMVDGHLSRPSSPSNAFHNILPHHPNNNIPMQQGAQFQSPPQLCQPYPNMVAPQMQQQYMYSTPKPPMHNQQFQSMQSSPTNQMCYLAHPCESNQIKTELNLSNKDPSLCNQVTSNDPYPIKQLYACNQMKHSLDNSQNQRISNNVTLKMVNVSPGETIVESEIPSNRSSKTNIPFQNNPGLNSNLTKDGDCSSINTNMSMNHYLDHDQPQITKQWYPFNRPTTPNEKPTVNNYLNLGTQNQAKNSVCYQGTPNQPQGRSDGTINLPKQNMYYYENPHETKLNSPNQNQCSVNNTSSYVVLGPSSVMNNNPIPKFGIIPRYHEKNNRTVGGQDLFPESTSYSTNSSLLPNQIEKFIEATDINPSSSAKDVLNEPLNLRSLSPSDGSDYKQQEDAESNSRASRSNSDHNKLSRTTSSADAKRRSSPNRPSSSEPPRTSRLPPVMGKVGPIIRAILECPQSVSSRPSSAVQIVKRSGAGGRSTSSGKLKKHRPRPQTPQRTYRSTAKCAELAPVNTGYRNKKKPVKNERDRDKLSKRQGQGKSIASSEESKTFDALKASLQLTGILNHVNNSDLLGKHIKPMEPITSCSSNPSVTNVQTLGEMSNTSLTSKKKMEVCCVDCCDGPKFCVQEAPSQAVATRLENMMKTSTAFALALENLKKAASEFESINCDDTAGLLRNVSISYNKKLDQCPNNKKSESHSLVLTLSAGSCEQDLSVSSRTRGGSSLVPKNSLELPHMVQKKANNIPNENRDDPKASEQPVNQRKCSSVCCKMNPSYFVKRPSKSYMKCCNSSKCRLLFSTHYNAVKLISKTKYIPGSSCEWVNIQSCSRVPAFKVEGKGAKYELPKQNLPSPYALHSSNCHNQSTQQQSKEPMKSKGNMPKSKRLDDDNK